MLLPEPGARVSVGKKTSSSRKIEDCARRVLNHERFSRKTSETENAAALAPSPPSPRPCAYEQGSVQFQWLPVHQDPAEKKIYVAKILTDRYESFILGGFVKVCALSQLMKQNFDFIFQK